MAITGKVTLLQFSAIFDPRGDLTALEYEKDIPFLIKRVYYLYNVPAGAERGGHAHKQLRQVLIALSGSFTVKLNDGSGVQSYFLNNPRCGLLLDRLVWREIVDFSHGAVCLCLASEQYNPDDYVRDQQEFLRRVEGNTGNNDAPQSN